MPILHQNLSTRIVYIYVPAGSLHKHLMLHAIQKMGCMQCCTVRGQAERNGKLINKLCSDIRRATKTKQCRRRLN